MTLYDERSKLCVMERPGDIELRDYVTGETVQRAGESGQVSVCVGESPKEEEEVVEGKGTTGGETAVFALGAIEHASAMLEWIATQEKTKTKRRKDERVLELLERFAVLWKHASAIASALEETNTSGTLVFPVVLGRRPSCAPSLHTQLSALVSSQQQQQQQPQLRESFLHTSSDQSTLNAPQSQHTRHSGSSLGSLSLLSFSSSSPTSSPRIAFLPHVGWSFRRSTGDLWVLSLDGHRLTLSNDLSSLTLFNVDSPSLPQHFSLDNISLLPSHLTQILAHLPTFAAKLKQSL